MEPLLGETKMLIGLNFAAAREIESQGGLHGILSTDVEDVLNGVCFRPSTPEDLSFLCTVYAEARAGELATTGWTDAEKDAFITQQFGFQHQYYREHHPNAQFLVITRYEEAIGRLYWRAAGDEANLMDISLLAPHRGTGIGTAIMRLLLARADADRQAITLYVEPNNPAHRLYCRCGFEVVGDNGVYLKMRRPAQGATCQ